MDGRTLSRGLARILNEDPDTSGFMHQRTSFDLLFQAMCEYIIRTQTSHSSQTITTVSGTSDYLLNADYLGLYMKDANDFYVVDFTTAAGNKSVIRYKDESEKFGQTPMNQATPGGFYVTDYRTAMSKVAVTIGATGSDFKAAGTGAGFLAGASVGDTIHNTTTGAYGVVTKVTSDVLLECGMFDGSSAIAGSGYVIPQGRFQLSLDNPSQNDGDTITLPYIRRPAPVYTYYDSYRLSPQDTTPLVYYAAFLYKYRDREPNYGDKWFMVWDRHVRLSGRQQNKAVGRTGFKVSFKRT